MATVKSTAATFPCEPRYVSHPRSSWDHKLIQSLHSRFSGPFYEERARLLVSEIKKMLGNELTNVHDNVSYAIWRLSVVDSLFALGIDRHFKDEITTALDSVHSLWKDYQDWQSWSPNLTITSLAFRLLRLQRYENVSPQAFEAFRCKDGEFTDKAVQLQDGSQTEAITVALQLLRASQIQFPGETILQQAETFAVGLLRSWLSKKSEADYPLHLVKEVEHVLEYPWHINVARWEARSYIDIYAANQNWLSSKMNEKILELARLDYNIVQALHQKEIQELLRWWNSKEISKWGFFRCRPVESYFWLMAPFFEPEHLDARIGTAKASILGYMLNDVYDTCATLQEVNVLAEASRRWDFSMVESLQPSLRAFFKFFCDTVAELSDQCSAKQGRDMDKYVRQQWIGMVNASQRKAIWLERKEMPSLEKYLKNGSAAVGLWTASFTGKLLVCESFPMEALERGLTSPPPIDDICGMSGRVADDISDYEEGDVLSAVLHLMTENPMRSKEDVVKELKEVVMEMIRKASKLCLLPRQNDEEFDVPFNGRRVAFDLTRGGHFAYKFRDGWTVGGQELKSQIRSMLFENVHLYGSSRSLHAFQVTVVQLVEYRITFLC